VREDLNNNFPAFHQALSGNKTAFPKKTEYSFGRHFLPKNNPPEADY